LHRGAPIGCNLVRDREVGDQPEHAGHLKAAQKQIEFLAVHVSHEHPSHLFVSLVVMARTGVLPFTAGLADHEAVADHHQRRFGDLVDRGSV
jgi:hypothetical protein